MILSKNYDEVFFVRDEEMFALILDYESAMFTLDTIKENTTGTSEYVNDMSKGTLHFAQPLFKLDVGGNSEEEEEFAKNLQKRNIIKMMKDLIYIKYGTSVPVSTHKDFLKALLKYNNNVSDNKKKNKDKDPNKVTLDDIILPEKTKKELRKIVDMMNKNEMIVKIGSKPIKGVIFEGVGGVGKTLTGRALANEINAEFKSYSAASFKGKYQGVGTEKLQKIFDEARKFDKCVIFLDELDALVPSRELGGHNDDSNQTVNEFLNQMDGFKKDENIFVIGSTNRLDMIDESAKRSGRFDVVLHFDLPNFDNKVDLFKLYIDKMETKGEFDFEKLANESGDISGADIANIVNQSGIHAVLELDKNYIEEQDIIDTIERLGMGKKENKTVKIGFSVNN